MAQGQEALVAGLTRALARHLEGTLGPQPEVTGLKRLTAGAANETWRFDAIGGNAIGGDAIGGRRRIGCILRRSPASLAEAAADANADAAADANADGSSETNLGKAGEAAVQQAAREAGVAAAEVLFVLDAEDGLGDGYVMTLLEGETIPRRILRDPEYAQLREHLAYDCGRTLAQLHSVDPARIPALNRMGAAEQLARYGEIYRSFGQPVPVFDLALRWLADRRRDPDRLTLVHGDFRNGNLMVGPEGIRAVMDWELAHLGDPMEDLGWLCVTSWRFGEIDRPVGGFGQREDLFAGYEAAGGGRVDPDAVRYWEVFGTLKWGIMCMIMTHSHLSGVTRSVEKAAIGRRVSETELDLLNLLT